MEKKIAYLKEKQIKKNAQKQYDNFVENYYVENPIKAKFLAFKKAKKDIDFKDLI